MISNNLDIEGHFTFNSEKYSVNDLVNALLSQGIAIHKVGPNLRIGLKTINPIVNSQFNYPSQAPDSINDNVIQGLASQIQRIFGELNKLKDHLGVNSNVIQNLPENEKQLFNFFSGIEKTPSNSSFENKNKWESFVPSKNFDFQAEKIDTQIEKTRKFSFDKETNNYGQPPIITLGRKKNPSLVDEYNDLVTNKGIADDEALDSLSSKLFNTANKTLLNMETKQDLLTKLYTPASESSSLLLSASASPDHQSFNMSKCDKCNSKIPSEAQFCSKCGSPRNNSV